MAKTVHGIISQIIDDWKKYRGLDKNVDFNVESLCQLKDEYNYHELAGIIKVYTDCEYAGEITMWAEPDMVLLESRFYGVTSGVAITGEYEVYLDDRHTIKVLSDGGYRMYGISGVPELLGYEEFFAAETEN